MAKWYYYKENGEKIGPMRGRELKQLAAQGIITPETWIENEEKTALRAGQAANLVFETVYMDTMDTPPPQSDSFVEPNPFTAPMPVEPNPFTLPMPTEPNPFDPSLNPFGTFKKTMDYLYANPNVFVAILGIVAILTTGGLIILCELINWLFRPEK